MEERALTVRETMDIAAQFAKSGMFPDSKAAEQAFVKVMAGQELGVPPFAAMTGIHVIQGKATLGAGIIASRIKASGKYDYRVLRLDDEGCELAFFENGNQAGLSSFDKADAKAAGVLSNPTWTKFPRNMCFARAISNGARWYCPDVFSGSVYTPDELGADVDVIDVTPTEIDPAKQEAANDWILDSTARARFWAKTSDMGLTHGEVHKALDVNSLKGWNGTEAQAYQFIDAWLDARTEAAVLDDHADEIEQPELVEA